MSEEGIVRLSRYEIYEIPGTRTQGHVICHTVLKRKSNGVFEELVPNAGSLDNARFIVKSLQTRDDEARRASEERERDFQESLTQPHSFILANTRVKLCYCGKPDGDPIHTKDEEESI